MLMYSESLELRGVERKVSEKTKTPTSFFIWKKILEPPVFRLQE